MDTTTAPLATDPSRATAVRAVPVRLAARAVRAAATLPPAAELTPERNRLVREALDDPALPTAMFTSAI